VWPQIEGPAEAALTERLVAAGATRRPNGRLIDADRAAAAAADLTAAGLGPVTIARPDFVFDIACAPFARLAAEIKKRP
jgi:ATP phosphoribosyltransferase